ncbi:hypothetical protein CDL15_Pgr019767 [Punica granatum]|uniref:Uncharacterized protein n=1 Tax=Punica granatum TaxID=22663 RepID=A0A218X6A9_PUNGR|nr:hypothetical protein CDL15_Pgr019767 [Punica granatum]
MQVSSPSKIALGSLIDYKMRKVYNVTQSEEMQNGLKNLEVDIQDLEEGLESLYRRLIKSRVHLLNILNH